MWGPVKAARTATVIAPRMIPAAIAKGRVVVLCAGFAVAPEPREDVNSVDRLMLKNALILSLGALAGCSGSAPPAGPLSPATPGAPPANAPRAELAHVDEHLARLRALEVIEVGALIVDLPQEAYACYGLPCPGSEAVVAAAKEHAAVRLASFTSAAVTAAATPLHNACEKASIDANLAALKALKIVELAGLIEQQPKNNPQCYNFPCAEDLKAAADAKCARAGELASIVQATKGL